MGVPAPDFLVDLGFIGTLGTISVLSAVAWERARLPTWLFAALAVGSTLIVFSALLVVMRFVTR